MFTPEFEEQYQRFAELREDWLLNFGYNTARAYWADLDDVLWWAAERGQDPLALTDGDINKYVALLKRRGYSDGTVRRRRTAWRGFSAYSKGSPHVR
jgi:site-specific recombinase XerD